MEVVLKIFDEMLQSKQILSYSLFTRERLSVSDVSSLSQLYLELPRRRIRNKSNKPISSENL